MVCFLPSSSAKQERSDLRNGFAEDVDSINGGENISDLARMERHESSAGNGGKTKIAHNDII